MNAVIGKNPKKITPIQDQNPTTTLTFFRIQTGNGRNQQVHPVVKKCRHLATKIQNKRKWKNRKKRENRQMAALNQQQNLVKNLVRNLAAIIAKKSKNLIQKRIVFVNLKITRQV